MSGSGFSIGGRLGGSMGGFGGGYGEQDAAPAAGSDADLIVETTTQTFVQDVIEASLQTPILVDFWAPWCQPCRQLTPIIEKVVKDARGAVRLVKMNIEEYPEVAGQMGVQSIPAVVAFKEGKPVDGFMGAQPESQIKAFIERLGVSVGPNEVEQLLEQADAARDQEEYAQAAQFYASALSFDQQNTHGIAGLAMCYLALGEKERAVQTLDMVPEDKRDDQQYIAAKAAIELAEQAEELDDLADLKARVEARDDDYQARFDLAVALNSKGDKTGAVDHLIEIIKRDREWEDDKARTQLLQFFEAWGFKDTASAYGRRKLSSILFS